MAAHYGYIYIDTGALYRSVGLYVYRSGIDPRDEEAVAAILPLLTVDIAHTGGIQQIFLCGENVSDAIREHIISRYASDVSAYPQVRKFLYGLQRSIAEKNNVVMDGRDIGTVILPDADVKIFLTASEEVRAMRRFNELTAKGQNVQLESVRRDLNLRDMNDSTRVVAPTAVAADAVIIDNSSMTAEETLAAAVEIADKKIKYIKGKIRICQLDFIREYTGFFKPVIRWFYRMKVTGGENEPLNVPCIICANHLSNQDVVILGASVKRQVRFFAKAELFRIPLLGPLITALGSFPGKTRRRVMFRQ